MNVFRYMCVEDGRNIVMSYINSRDATKIGLSKAARVKLSFKKFHIYSNVVIDDSVPDGTIRVNQWGNKWVLQKDGSTIYVESAEESGFPDRLAKIRRGEELQEDDVSEIMNCIRHNDFVSTEMFDFIKILQEKDLTTREIALFTKNFTEESSDILLDGDIYGFHSLGGVPGNKITPIIVSIVAAAGITIPKLSTRAITSACGTVDSTSIYCEVILRSDRIKNICETTGGAFACVDSLYIGTYNTDLILMTGESILGINPRSIMLASIMAEERAAGVKNLLIDFPMWPRGKINNMEIAKNYEKQFVDIGRMNGMNVKCIITDACQPIGFAIGPTLEAIECIRILEGKEKKSSAKDKACLCAGTILEMAGRKDGVKLATEILESGKAFAKFREIVAAQNGNPNISSDDFKIAKYCNGLNSDKKGKVVAIDNKIITKIAKIAGAPSDVKAGIVLNCKIGDSVEDGCPLATIYSDDRGRMDIAAREFAENNPFTIE